MRFWRVLLLTMSLLLFPVRLVDAEAPPSPSRTLAELQGLFPNLAQLPPGMVVQETGGRTAEDIAATFPDPVDALDALSLGSPTGNTPPIASWAQPGAPLSTPARIEVSLHQFSSSGGAAYMLPYFAQGRAAMLGQQMQPAWLWGPCRGWVQSDGEATLYVRIGDLLARITGVVQDGVTGYDVFVVKTNAALNVASALLTNAGSSRQLLDQTCQ